MFRSIVVGLAVMAIGMVLLTLMSVLYIVPATVSAFCKVWLFAIPLSAAFAAGWNNKHKYLLLSMKSVLIIWIIGAILVVWFYPFDLSWKIMPITLVTSQVIAVLGAIIGSSMHQALTIYHSNDGNKEE